jgi:uncharacterized protein YcbK (DUF882 family)
MIKHESGFKLGALRASDKASIFLAFTMVAIIFFTLGLGIQFVTSHEKFFASHREPVTFATVAPAPAPKEEPPQIKVRIINAVPERADSAGQDTPSGKPEAAAKVETNTRLEPTPAITPLAKPEAQETRKSVRCLQPKARALLAEIEARFGRMGIISTCRPGAVVAGTGHPSRHRYGLAIDFNAPRGKKSEIVSWLVKNHRAGGTMTYGDSNHIHVDIGPHFVSLASGYKTASRHRCRHCRDEDEDDD